MRIDHDQDRSKPVRKQVTPEDMRARCAFRLQKMATPTTADDGRRKSQFNKLAKLTGLGVRRVEKLFRGYVMKPLAHECESIEVAYRQWLEDAKARALADLQNIERENDRLQKSAADYVSSSWRRACEAGAEDRALGGAAAGTANDS